MRKIILVLLGFLAVGCSSSDENQNENPALINPNKLTVDGVELPIADPTMGYTGYSAYVYRNGDLFTVVYGNVGNLNQTDSMFNMTLVFTREGKFISGYMNFHSDHLYNQGYNNFRNFPSNYFQAISMEINETTKRIKLNYLGKLYENPLSLSSESRNIQGIIDLPYTDNGNETPPLVYSGIEQYCRANLNSVPWKAWSEHTMSSFMSHDAYKIETHFANSPTPGSFAFNSASTDNYVRLSKFNTVTLTFDYYNVSGQVAYSYREFHGATRYSFIGTFSFTAVNPNNPADVIQVTDGVFRSYQQF